MLIEFKLLARSILNIVFLTRNIFSLNFLRKYLINFSFNLEIGLQRKATNEEDKQTN